MLFGLLFNLRVGRLCVSLWCFSLLGLAPILSILRSLASANLENAKCFELRHDSVSGLIQDSSRWLCFCWCFD